MDSIRKRIVYRFIRKGEVVSKDSNNEYLQPKVNRIFLDVGNDLTKGIIDQHQGIDGIYIEGNIYQSVASILCASPYLLLENLDESIEETEIILHSEPDFDCFASAYIAKELVENRKLPQNYQYLCDYAEAIDSGRIKIENGNVCTGFAIAYAIEEVIKTDNTDIRRNELDRLSLERGLQLVEFMMERLDKIEFGVKSLYNPSIILSDCIFSREIELLKEDYKRYQKDIVSICRRRIVSLPVKDKEGILQPVDALFWEMQPSCILHKYWARSDKNSPSGTGYAFTFIPWENRMLDEDKINILKSVGLNINTSHSVVLSVDPNSSVYLKNLGQILEKYECMKEKSLGIEDKWRNRNILRYEEEWCTNDDPWFDGRSFNYTIVDAPRIGSLLTIEEIESIFMEYTKTKTVRSFNRFVLPFNFEHQEYKNLIKVLSGNKNLHKKSFSKEETGYFLNFINDYFFGGEGIENGKNACPSAAHYVFCDGFIKHVLKEVNFLNIKSSCLTLFKYGTGVFYFDIENADDTIVSFEDILKLNKRVSNIFNSRFDMIKNILSNLIDNSYVDKLNLDEKELLIWSITELDRKTVYKSELEKMAYKLSNFLEWNEIDKEIKNIYNVEDFAIFGFTASGGSLILVDNDDLDGRVKDKIQQLYSEFKEKYFNIFLLSLQKRNTMIYFAQKLASFKSKRSQKQISRLRAILLDFMAQGWFSQITNNEFGAEVYSRWESIFNCEVLYNEVVEQLEIIDDYYEAKYNNKFQIFSSIFFPAITLASIYGLGFIELDPIITVSKGTTLIYTWIAFGVICILFGVLMYLALRFRDKD